MSFVLHRQYPLDSGWKNSVYKDCSILIFLISAVCHYQSRIMCGKWHNPLLDSTAGGCNTVSTGTTKKKTLMKHLPLQ
jgi:hypothetical protein